MELLDWVVVLVPNIIAFNVLWYLYIHDYFDRFEWRLKQLETRYKEFQRRD